MPFNPEYLELHVFVDASKVAYSVVTYFRLHHPIDQRVEITLLMGKARSSLKAEYSIPRLELIAAVIGSHLIQFLRESLNITVPTTLWSDFKCVLVWLKRLKILPTFVENRVKEIHAVPQIDFRCLR